MKNALETIAAFYGSNIQVQYDAKDQEIYLLPRLFSTLDCDTIQDAAKLRKQLRQICDAWVRELQVTFVVANDALYKLP